jgi:hypothetical protein
MDDRDRRLWRLALEEGALREKLPAFQQLRHPI